MKESLPRGCRERHGFVKALRVYRHGGNCRRYQNYSGINLCFRTAKNIFRPSAKSLPDKQKVNPRHKHERHADPVRRRAVVVCDAAVPDAEPACGYGRHRMSQRVKPVHAEDGE